MSPSIIFCLGMNACLRAIVRTALYVGCKVFYVKEGYQGMIDGDIQEATWASVSSIIHKVCMVFSDFASLCRCA